MNLIIMGPPGAGKGTQGDYICSDYSIPKISTGNMLRAAQMIDPDLKEVMASGKLVSDEKIIQILLHRIKQTDCHNGFLLDGFPRTIAQAEALQSAGVNIDAVIVLQVADNVIIERNAGRRIHYKSGRTYHVLHNPPKTEGKDDISGEPLVQREDDKEETVRERLKVYSQQTQPLIAWYQQHSNETATKFFEIDGAKQVKDVRDDVKKLLEGL